MFELEDISDYIYVNNKIIFHLSNKAVLFNFINNVILLR